MPLHARIAVFLIVLAVGLAARAAESTVYKVVDPEGKVTYQDHPPEPGTPAVERLEMRTDQNVLKSAAPGEAPAAEAPAPPPGPASRSRTTRSEPRSPELRREEAAAIVEKALQNNEALDEPGEEAASSDTPPDAAAGSP